MHHLQAPALLGAGFGVLALLAGRPLDEPAPTSGAAAECDEAIAALVADLASGERNDAGAFHGGPPHALWSRGGRPTSAARDALDLLAGAGRHGLDPRQYLSGTLAERARVLDEAGGCAVGELAEWDIDLTRALAAFLTDVHQGRARSPEGFEAHGDLTAPALADRVRAATAVGRTGSLDTELEPGYGQYRNLKRALARLPPEPLREPDDAAMARRIAVALERLRWLPHAPDGPLIVANIPAFRLVALRSSRDPSPALRMRIVVGHASRTRTPVFVGAVDEVVFHPPWYPPASIVRNEILPHLAEDARYLERAHFDVVSPTGSILPATEENLARVRAGALRLRQPPGADNPLGRVKFVFPNDYRVYLHDTPSRALFDRPPRDFSHGCIRVEDAPALAAFVLAGAPEFSQEEIEAALLGTRTTSVPVRPAVPVYIAYTTTIARADGAVEIFDDVYGLDASVSRSLEPGSDAD